MGTDPTYTTRGERTNPLAQRLFRSAIATLDLYAVYLGDRLGLYRALAEGGLATSGELARRTGANERYVREFRGGVASLGA